MKVNRLSELAFLSALSLIIFIIEINIPNPFPVPGVKLGLANIITVYAVFRYRPYETVLVVAVRLILGSMLCSSFSALIFSAAGALCCLTGMILLSGIISEDNIWLCSIIGAALHNIGQTAAAILVMNSIAAVWYLPFLLIAGTLAGMFTGLCAQFLMKRLHKRI